MTYSVYSKDGCPYCVKVVRALQLAEVKYVVLKLGRDFTREEFIDKFGRSTFPKVLQEETLIGGFTETVKYLRENKLI
jgi:glutaredoxin 3|tara:strand:- start:99 stop:332 length:234 start_codon:yes stop_codon:yes gene_type:complete